MAGRSGSFIRNTTTQCPLIGAKPGPNTVPIVSTGFADLDKVLGGGIPVGGIVMIMEDSESPHHLLLLRYFMAQGLVHDQPLLFASPLPSPQAFLGTLPNASQTNDSMLDVKALSNKMQGEGLRIAWQYRKYDMDSQPVERNRSSLKETISGHLRHVSVESVLQSLSNKVFKMAIIQQRTGSGGNTWNGAVLQQICKERDRCSAYQWTMNDTI